MSDGTVLDPVDGISGGDRLHGRFRSAFSLVSSSLTTREISFGNGKP
jgi:hypothetical protein